MRDYREYQKLGICYQALLIRLVEELCLRAVFFTPPEIKYYSDSKVGSPQLEEPRYLPPYIYKAMGLIHEALSLQQEADTRDLDYLSAGLTSSQAHRITVSLPIFPSTCPLACFLGFNFWDTIASTGYIQSHK